MTKYRNPTAAVDVILECELKVLIVRRSKDPFKDYLSLPGGFVNGRNCRRCNEIGGHGRDIA